MVFSNKKFGVAIGLLFVSGWMGLAGMNYRRGPFDYDLYNDRKAARNTKERDAFERYQDAKKEKDDKDKEIKACRDENAKATLIAQLKDLEKEYNAAKKHYDEVVKPTLARLIATSMVDTRHSEYMGEVDGFWNAVGQGVAVNIADQAGVVLRKRIAGILDKILGGSLDFCTSKIQGFFEDLYMLIFYSGNMPFTSEALAEWQVAISTLLVDIERTIEKGLATSLRGHDMSLRGAALNPKVDDENDGQDPKLEESLPKHDVLQELILCYIEQFSRLIIEIEMRKQGYSDNTLIVFYATQIQRHLDSLAKTLSRADSLAALDAAFNSNKSIIVAIRNNITSLFNSLKIQIAPRSYSVGKDTSSGLYDSNRPGRMGRGSYMDDEQAYPSSFGGAHGSY